MLTYLQHTIWFKCYVHIFCLCCFLELCFVLIVLGPETSGQEGCLVLWMRPRMKLCSSCWKDVQCIWCKSSINSLLCQYIFKWQDGPISKEPYGILSKLNVQLWYGHMLFVRFIKCCLWSCHIQNLKSHLSILMMSSCSFEISWHEFCVGFEVNFVLFCFCGLAYVRWILQLVRLWYGSFEVSSLCVFCYMLSDLLCVGFEVISATCEMLSCVIDKSF